MVTAQEAKTEFVQVGEVKYAYRRLGTKTGVPLLCLMHIRGTIDHWDPALINTLASSQPVILFDNSGVGYSTGNVVDSVQAMANNVISFLSALQIHQVNILGYSMGGWVAQMLAISSPHLVRRLVLAGTSPSGGDGVIRGSAELRAMVSAPTPNVWNLENAYRMFFGPSDRSRAAAKPWWDRLQERGIAEENIADIVSGTGLFSMGKAAENWMGGGPDGSYDKLDQIKAAVFIAAGSHDEMSPPLNSVVLWQRIANSHLHIYPDSAHGFLYQHVNLFATHVQLFLNEDTL